MAVLVAAALGAFVQGSVGFGHNLVAAPVFALADERLVPGPAIASAGFFLTGIVMSLLALVVTGSFGVEELRLSALPLPAIALGFALSSWGARRLDSGQTRPAVLAVAALSAVSVLVDALR